MTSIALTETAKYIVIPLLAPALGALITLRSKPTSQVKSLVRHIAAGLVFAAATIELLPSLLKDKQPLATIVGFALGVGLLLAVNRLLGGHYHGDKDETHEHQHVENEAGGSLTGLMTAIYIDLGIDGLLIGIGFATGVVEGRLLTLALTIEAIFIGLSIVASCREHGMSISKSFLVAGSTGVVLALGALIGASVLSGLHGAFHQAVLAFGVAALLYLVTEELLVEAHETPDEPVEVVGFFTGFLLILALAIL
jgi:ZIP family zinc transporter